MRQNISSYAIGNICIYITSERSFSSRLNLFLICRRSRPGKCHIFIHTHTHTHIYIYIYIFISIYKSRYTYIIHIDGLMRQNISSYAIGNIYIYFTSERSFSSRLNLFLICRRSRPGNREASNVKSVPCFRRASKKDCEIMGQKKQ